MITIHLFELPRMQKASMAGLTPMEGWLFLLKNLHTFDGEPEGMDPRFKKVTSLASFYYLPDKEQLQYIRAMISEEEKQDLLGGAYEQGVDDGRNEIARKMKGAGYPTDEIARMTGLSEECVLAL